MFIRPTVFLFLLLVIVSTSSDPCLNPNQPQDSCSACRPDKILFNSKCYEKIRGCIQYVFESNIIKCIICQNGYIFEEGKCQRKAVHQLRQGGSIQKLNVPAPVAADIVQRLHRNSLPNATNQQIEVNKTQFKRQKKKLEKYPEIKINVKENNRKIKQIPKEIHQQMRKKFTNLDKIQPIKTQFHNFQQYQNYKGSVQFDDATLIARNKLKKDKKLQNSQTSEPSSQSNYELFMIPHNKQYQSSVSKIKQFVLEKEGALISTSLSVNYDVNLKDGRIIMLNIDLFSGQISILGKNDPNGALTQIFNENQLVKVIDYDYLFRQVYQQFLDKVVVLDIPDAIQRVEVKSTDNPSVLLFNITYPNKNQPQKEYSIIRHNIDKKQTEIVGYFIENKNILDYFNKQQEKNQNNAENSVKANQGQQQEEKNDKEKENIQKIIQEKKELEARKIEDENKQAEEKRKIEEKVKQQEKKIAEQKRISDQKRKAQQKRIQQEKKIIQEKRQADERRILEEKKIAEERRIAEQKKINEQKRVLQQKKIAEEKRIAQQKLASQEKRKRQQKRIAQQLLAEQKRIIEYKKLAEQESKKLVKPSTIKTGEDMISELKKNSEFAQKIEKGYKILQFNCKESQNKLSVVHKLKVYTGKGIQTINLIQNLLTNSLKVGEISEQAQSCIIETQNDPVVVKLESALRKNYAPLQKYQKFMVQLALREGAQKYSFIYSNEQQKRIIYEVTKAKDSSKYQISKNGFINNSQFYLPLRDIDNINFKMSNFSAQGNESLAFLTVPYNQVMLKFKNYVSGATLVAALTNGTHIKLYITNKFITYQFEQIVQEPNLNNGELTVVDQKYGYDVISSAITKQVIKNSPNQNYKIIIRDALNKKYRSYFSTGVTQIYCKQKPSDHKDRLFQVIFKCLLGYFNTVVSITPEGSINFPPMKKTLEFDDPQTSPACAQNEYLDINDKRCFTRIQGCFKQVGNMCVLCEPGYVVNGKQCHKYCIA